ncbi:MAG: PAS domain S-box protein, partial [Desulfobacterales bacterium]|nr:PAS domain S-box protein [Desulfobacterales bacterium]
MYENIITIIDIISACAFGLALLLVVRISRSIIDEPSKIFLGLCMGIYVFVGISNILQHGQITDHFDRYEDYSEIFFPLLFLFFIYSVITRRELNKQIQSEHVAQRVSQDWEDIFEAIDHPTIILDPQHGIISVNRAAVRATGRSEQELLQKKCYEIFHGTDQPPGGCPLEKMLISGHPETVAMEVEALGGIFLVSCTPVLDDEGNMQKVIHIATDITEQKRAEEALRKSEGKLRNIVENSTNLFYSHTTDHMLTYLSPQVHDILGYKPEEAMVIWTELASDNPINKEGFQRTEKAIKTGKTQAPYELELVHKSGKIVWAEIREAPIVENGKTISIVGVLTDITERKRTDNETKESEEKYRTLIETANDAILVADVETGIILDVNKRAEELLSMPAEKIIGMHQSQLHPKEKAEQYQKIFKKHVQKGTAILEDNFFIC